MKILLIFLVLFSSTSFAGRLQDVDFMTEAQLIISGGSAQQLLNGDKIYITSIAKTLDDAIMDGDIGGGGGAGLPLMAKGSILASNGITNGEFFCPNGESIEWDSTVGEGIKCVTAGGGADTNAGTICNFDYEYLSGDGTCISFLAIPGNMTPALNDTIFLGTPTKTWANMYTDQVTFYESGLLGGNINVDNLGNLLMIGQGNDVILWSTSVGGEIEVRNAITPNIDDTINLGSPTENFNALYTDLVYFRDEGFYSGYINSDPTGNLEVVAIGSTKNLELRSNTGEVIIYAGTSKAKLNLSPIDNSVPNAIATTQYVANNSVNGQILAPTYLFGGTSGTFFPNAATKFMRVTVVGGGGSGGSNNFCSYPSTSPSSGGTSGYVYVYEYRNPGASYVYSVGLGGSVAPAGSNGSSGGSSVWDGVSSFGGSGGFTTSCSTTYLMDNDECYGGLSSTTFPDANTVRKFYQRGESCGQHRNSQGGHGGNGGNTPLSLGQGGKSYPITLGTQNFNGTLGFGYGSGGGAGFSNSGGTTGGAGAQGVIIIEQY